MTLYILLRRDYLACGARHGLVLVARILTCSLSVGSKIERLVVARPDLMT